MKLIATMPVRSEDWILGCSLRAVLRWCDEVVVLNHASTDNSAVIIGEVARENPFRVTLIEDAGEKWDEMPQRQRMLEAARRNQATHIAIVDADEILTGNLLSQIRSDIANLPPGYAIEVPGYNLRGSLTKYHQNGIWGNRWFSLAFADNKRVGWVGDQFHARLPAGLTRTKPYQQNVGGVMHLWGTSERRLRAKHRLYRITERLRWPSKPAAEIEEMYSWATKGRPAANDTPERWRYNYTHQTWWAPYADIMRHIHSDAEPWQEAECARLIALHGPKKFAGLDLS